jgi:hypothetical protein
MPPKKLKEPTTNSQREKTPTTFLTLSRELRQKILLLSLTITKPNIEQDLFWGYLERTTKDGTTWYPGVEGPARNLIGIHPLIDDDMFWIVQREIRDDGDVAISDEVGVWDRERAVKLPEGLLESVGWWSWDGMRETLEGLKNGKGQ